jgi:amino acid transporter
MPYLLLVVVVLFHRMERRVQRPRRWSHGSRMMGLPILLLLLIFVVLIVVPLLLPVAVGGLFGFATGDSERQVPHGGNHAPCASTQ